MKCQNCGNELGQDEVFCGQCGAQQTAPAQQTEMMPTSAPKSGLLGNNYRSGAFTPSQPGQSFANENVPAQGPSAIRQEPHQSGGYYQDATEAYSMIPGSPVNYPQGSYPQQSMQGGMSMPGGYN